MEGGRGLQKTNRKNAPPQRAAAADTGAGCVSSDFSMCSTSANSGLRRLAAGCWVVVEILVITASLYGSCKLSELTNLLITCSLKRAGTGRSSGIHKTGLRPGKIVKDPCPQN